MFICFTWNIDINNFEILKVKRIHIFFNVFLGSNIIKYIIYLIINK